MLGAIVAIPCMHWYVVHMHVPNAILLTLSVLISWDVFPLTPDFQLDMHGPQEREKQDCRGRPRKNLMHNSHSRSK